jgi:hypothetical protein
MIVCNKYKVLNGYFVLMNVMFLITAAGLLLSVYCIIIYTCFGLTFFMCSIADHLFAFAFKKSPYQLGTLIFMDPAGYKRLGMCYFLIYAPKSKPGIISTKNNAA